MLRTFLTIFLVTSLSAQPITWSDPSTSISTSKLHNLNSINIGYDNVDAKENEDLSDDFYENLTSDKIIEVIENLPEVNDIKIDDEKSIVKARKLVTEFNNDSAISNLDKLVAAENKISQLKEDKANEEQKAKELAAITAIDNLPAVDSLTLKDAKAVSTARKLVTIANNDIAITNLEKLVAAESKISQLKDNSTDEKQKNKELAAITAIDNLPAVDSLTLEDTKAVTNARHLVKVANNDAAITNLEKLVASENKISQLKEDKAKEEQRNKELAAITAIDNLPAVDSLTLEHAKAVANARHLVKVANNNAAITNLDKLIAAEAKIAELKANNEAIKDDNDNCEDKVDNRNNSPNNRIPDNSRENSRGGNRADGRGGNRDGRNMGHSSNRGERR